METGAGRLEEERDRKVGIGNRRRKWRQKQED